MKEPAIIIDLDGTLTNPEHRMHFIKQAKKDWESFMSPDLLSKDIRNVWCAEIIRAMSAHLMYEIILLTGRSETSRQATEEWLEENGVSYDLLLMRPEGDFRHDDVVKKEIYLRDIEPHYDVLFAIDDRKRNIEMFRSLGIPGLLCSEGEF